MIYQSFIRDVEIDSLNVLWDMVFVIWILEVTLCIYFGEYSCKKKDLRYYTAGLFDDFFIEVRRLLPKEN